MTIVERQLQEEIRGMRDNLELVIIGIVNLQRYLAATGQQLSRLEGLIEVARRPMSTDTIIGKIQVTDATGRPIVG